jgi:lupus La protein
MSAPAAEVEATQPAVVDAAPAETTAQDQTQQEDSADAQLKQEESASKTEADGDSKMLESDSKPAPLMKTKAQLHKDKSNKKFDPSVLPVTDNPNDIRKQVSLPADTALY